MVFHWKVLEAEVRAVAMPCMDGIRQHVEGAPLHAAQPYVGWVRLLAVAFLRYACSECELHR